MKRRSPRNSRNHKLVRTTVITVALCIAVLLLPRVATFMVNTILYPFHATGVWLRESDQSIPVFVRERQSLLADIKQLEDDLRIAKSNTVTEQHLLQENSRLRQLLGIAKESRIAASVIARPNELPYDLLQIDQGRGAGVEVGAPVFAGTDTAIGLITHVAEHYSFVQLFTSPDFRATVFISGPDIVANIEGFGGGVARVRVPQGVPLTAGNLVYIPSIEPGVFGRITHVENVPTQAEQYGYVSPDIAISELHFVAVGQVSQISRDPTEIDQSIRDYLATSLSIPAVALGAVTTTASTTVRASTTVNSSDGE